MVHLGFHWYKNTSAPLNSSRRKEIGWEKKNIYILMVHCSSTYIQFIFVRDSFSINNRDIIYRFLLGSFHFCFTTLTIIALNIIMKKDLVNFSLHSMYFISLFFERSIHIISNRKLRNLSQVSSIYVCLYVNH